MGEQSRPWLYVCVPGNIQAGKFGASQTAHTRIFIAEGAGTRTWGPKWLTCMTQHLAGITISIFESLPLSFLDWCFHTESHFPTVEKIAPLTRELTYILA